MIDKYRVSVESEKNPLGFKIIVRIYGSAGHDATWKSLNNTAVFTIRKESSVQDFARVLELNEKKDWGIRFSSNDPAILVDKMTECLGELAKNHHVSKLITEFILGAV